MKICPKIMYHIAANSNVYELIILGCIIGLYETWKNYDEIKKNIFSSIIYSLIFVFGIFGVINFQVFIACCAKVKQKLIILKFISDLKQFNENFVFSLNYLKTNDEYLYKVFMTEISSLCININKAIEILNSTKNENSLNRPPDNKDASNLKNNEDNNN